MHSRILGAFLLIIGTCIGGSILALPLVTAGLNVFATVTILILVWLVMTLSAMYIVDLDLNLEGRVNLISMAKSTLGDKGVIITWLSYLLLLYTLLSAYLEGGTDLVTGLLHLIHINISNWAATLIFLSVFIAVIYHGILYIDWTNRGLMTIKLLSFFLLVGLLLPTGQITHLNFISNHINPINSIMPIANAFGFAIIIPSISHYLNKKPRVVKLTTLAGSLVPMLVYLLWILTIQANVDNSLLMQLAHSPNSISQLALAIQTNTLGGSISYLSHLFISICITTSFLGVSLALIDFLIDGFQIKKINDRVHWGILAVAFVPPTLVVLLRPGIFITTIKLAGMLCVMLLILLPTLMMWSACYNKSIIKQIPVYCRKPFLILNMIAAIVLFVLAITAFM